MAKKHEGIDTLSVRLVHSATAKLPEDSPASIAGVGLTSVLGLGCVKTILRVGCAQD